MSAPRITKAQSPAVVEKKQDKPSLVELKNGKVYFKQKPLSLEKQSETLQEIVRFRDVLEERIKNSEPSLTTFPDEHKPVIAKLAHESDKTLSALTKHIHQELLPTIDEDEDASIASAITTALPASVVETVIEEVLVRNNYGVDAPLGVKLPAGVCVWRWEVRSEHMAWLPKNSKEKAETRHQERLQAKEDLKSLFNALTQEERDAIIDPKGTNKLPAKELNKPSTPSTSSEAKVEDTKDIPQSSKKQGKKKAEEPENENHSESSKAPRPKKVQDPEKVAKERERMEKKAARLEKEKKKEEAHNKSKSIMAKFFVKPAKPSRPTDVQQSAVAGPSRIQSDFEKTFKPFVLQKDKTLAPLNWFQADKKRKRRAALQTPNKKEIIVIDSEEDFSDIEMLELQPTEAQLSSMSPQARLKDILSSMPPSTSLSRPRTVQQRKGERGYKTYHPVSVRDLMTQLSEAEISGNDDLVRILIAKLSDRELLPAKAFCFDTDARPGYFGTWTRSSRIIGPRTPFAKDTLVFDYAYDSGEEWEEEPAGEDVVDNGDEEDGDADEQDSDLDSWLVDDDEEPDLELLSRSSPPPLFDLSNTPVPKRKAEDPEKKIGKKRKVVVPLVPFAKGPIFETTIGHCEYEPFRPYSIQLLNDTPHSIDPFTFVSTCLEDYKSSLQAPKPAQPTGLINALSDSTFVIPALPPHLTVSKPSTSTFDASTNSLNPPKKAPTLSKASFPDIYMNLLLTKITQLQASSITSLVESIYLDLREYKVKKVAIEAKVREVGQKCKDKKVWIVKPSLQQASEQQAQGS
ncbi:hypothetical protein BDN70DRAFT_882568 [Pholiota conissans]|uniref:Chromatin assembly factor 1 subunit A dimerization domain-containing protein n=1 Tax=Pholiota conissans TaxID=109636 RepID=A0A9P5YVA9_9AGAR|nr:hypothetical protein BDN70DRAFT_882568 [Pholiota conissans]